MAEEKKSLIEFPCRFPVKVMGAKAPDFPAVVMDVVREHSADLHDEHVQRRDSSGGNYLSLTLSVHVENQEQLDNIYRALTGHPMVKVVL